MDSIERLTAIFEKFPGIGPRQANRFVQYLLRSSGSSRRELIDAIEKLNSGVRQCPECMRFHAGSDLICSICRNPKRDTASMVVVASDTDLVALERSGSFTGHYFVLGGTVSLVSERSSAIRLRELLTSIATRVQKGLTEIILAFPANPEGDATAQRVREEIRTIPAFADIHITALGRGLSTGSELEYADPDTLHDALQNRR